MDKDRTVTINTNGAVSTQDFNRDFNLEIAPNPAFTPATISWNNTLLDETAKVEIRNSLGVLVFNKKIKPFENA
ncbi:hypothetical protein, partial [Streptococcus pseudopneumoniae]|uniref:hypothetical protein n=1 Tax=Streptococcus pseudopneumoniae TaxID=257758 RepID=UPI0018B081B6